MTKITETIFNMLAQGKGALDGGKGKHVWGKVSFLISL